MNSTVERNDLFSECNMIFEYTRAHAIADGVLIDLSNSFPSDTRMFKWPLACTSAVWNLIETAAASEDVSPALYVWDCSFMCLAAIKSASSGHGELPFSVLLPLTENGTEHKLKVVCGPGDNGEAVLTIMLPEED
ncbi:MAG: hypothetical protein JZU65_12305 [Chlorobium sp.]|nr:hypothetical protein [Chlorobium sp.]